jgi:outer membrane protein assembly factor BamB
MVTRIRACAVFLAVLSFVSIWSPLAFGSFKPPPALQGHNLANCRAQLERQGGGWCEIRVPGVKPSISSVWPRNPDARTRMVVGPSAVLRAWNGAAYDKAEQLFYFLGGGHADYGGNEVYEFDLKTGRWSRLTEPSPLNFLFRFRDKSSRKAARYCWSPDMRREPGSAHTYDGVQFSSRTKTIFYMMMGAANGSCFDDKAGKFDGDSRILFARDRGVGVFEFNPSRSETRNGLAPLTWRRLADPKRARLRYPRSLELPDGALIVGNRTGMYAFDPVRGVVGKRLWRNGDIGDGTAVYHPVGLALSLHSKDLLATSLRTGKLKRIPAPAMHGKALAVDANGIVFAWDGRSRILTVDPRAAEPRWRYFDWAGAGPADGHNRVYSKWQYVAGSDVFVGLSNHTTGVWVYKHPAAMPGVELAALDPQQIIDEAQAGTVVTIPPGLYGQGLSIGKSLTVRLKDVRLRGVARKKAIINVRCNGCDVVIEDFHGDGREAGCLDGNCAGIKAEGDTFRLTVRRARIDNTVMGILTDNRGGRLVVEDSVIENTGFEDRSDTLGHGVYAGKIDALILRGSTIRNVNGAGHLLKSRARATVLERSRLLGEHGFHSRSIDVPCGGLLQVTNSVIQHGEKSDNEDVIALGTEPGNCPSRPSQVSITDSWIVIDRGGLLGSNLLFRWRSPMASLELRGNRIVNLGKWSSAGTQRGDIKIADHSQYNEMCGNRAACGLRGDQVPIP